MPGVRLVNRQSTGDVRRIFKLDLTRLATTKRRRSNSLNIPPPQSKAGATREIRGSRRALTTRKMTKRQKRRIPNVPTPQSKAGLTREVVGSRRISTTAQYRRERLRLRCNHLPADENSSHTRDTLPANEKTEVRRPCQRQYPRIQDPTLLHRLRIASPDTVVQAIALRTKTARCLTQSEGTPVRETGKVHLKILGSTQQHRQGIALLTHMTSGPQALFQPQQSHRLLPVPSTARPRVSRLVQTRNQRVHRILHLRHLQTSHTLTTALVIHRATTRAPSGEGIGTDELGG
jgi:hypothetical protein